MPLTVTHLPRCPYLSPNDFIALDPSLQYTGTAIVDTIIGVHHTTHDSASNVLNALVRGVKYHTLYDIDQQLTDVQLRELLGFLNVIGGLKIHRSLGQLIRDVAENIRQMIYGVTYPIRGYRYSDTLYGITHATIAACREVLLLGGVVAIIAWIAGFGAGRTIIALYCTISSIFVCSIIAHEYGHLSWIHHAGARGIILRHGFHVRVLHRNLGSMNELYASLAGPFAGICVAVIGAGGALAAGCQSLCVAACLIAVMHFMSLLPCYADGRSWWCIVSSLKREPHV